MWLSARQPFGNEPIDPGQFIWSSLGRLHAQCLLDCEQQQGCLWFVREMCFKLLQGNIASCEQELLDLGSVQRFLVGGRVHSLFVARQEVGRELRETLTSETPPCR